MKKRNIKKAGLFLSTISILAFPFIALPNEDINQENKNLVNNYSINHNNYDYKNNFQEINVPPVGISNFSGFGIAIRTPGGDSTEGVNYPYKVTKESKIIQFNYQKSLEDYILGPIDSYTYINQLKYILSISKFEVLKKYMGKRVFSELKGESRDTFELIGKENSLIHLFTQPIDSTLKPLKYRKSIKNDYLDLKTNLRINNNFNSKSIIIDLSLVDGVTDRDGYDVSKGVFYWKIDHYIDTNIGNGETSFKLKFPYTSADVSQIYDKIKDIVAKPITFYSDDLNVYGPKNKTRIQNEFNKRVANFYANSGIQNSKIGAINNLTTLFEHARIAPSQSDKKGSAKHPLKFSLKDNKSFLGVKKNRNRLFNNGRDLEMNVEINILPISAGEYVPKDLINIKPYYVSELNHNYFIKPGEINDFELSNNLYNSNIFNNFSFNLNQKNNNGDYSLVPKDKIPLVMRYGLKLNFDLILKDDAGNSISKNIDIFYLYNNDETKISVDFGLFSGQNITLNMIVKFKDNKVLIENNGLNNLIFPSGTPIPKLSLLISNINSHLPSDQSSKEAKWTLESQTPTIDNFKTEEPFIFEMQFMERVGSTSARYIPIIDGEALGASPAILPGEVRQFKTNLGPYIMQQKQETGVVKIEIQIMEYDPSTAGYSKLAYTLNVNVDLNNSPLLYELNGWNSPTLTPEDKKKYFNIEDKKNYRGDYVDEQTGMYIPKVAWVNSIPPQTFLYDPLDQDGNKLLAQEGNSNGIIPYDIGYLAQINAPGFKDGDFESMPTIGGYKINYPAEYIADGKYPYSELYDFTTSSSFPSIKSESLTNNGMTFADKNLRQTVLKKNNSDSFVYQFAMISNQVDTVKNIFDLYKMENENGEKIFVDFWDTFHGANLLGYLQSINLIENLEAAKMLEFGQVNIYWAMYVNAMTSSRPVDQRQNLSTTFFDKIFLGIEDINLLGPEVKRKIQEQINLKVNKPSDTSLQLGIDYLICENEIIFNEKIKILAKNYQLDDPSKTSVTFDIIAISSSKYIRNSGKITISNSKFRPFDLSQIIGEDVLFNSQDSRNRPVDIINWIKQDLIYDLINREIIKETLDNKLVLAQDYDLRFYTEKINQNGAILRKDFKNIDDAINNCLLLNVDNKIFNNNLYVEVYASNSLDAYKLSGQYVKKYNNSDENNNPDIENRIYDLASIKNINPLKFNTFSANFPASSEIDKKEFLNGYLNNYINMTINNLIHYLNSGEARKPILGFDYMITSLDDETKTLDQIIDDFMIINDPTNFDTTINLKIRALNNSQILKNSFSFAINNSSKNSSLPDIDGEIEIEKEIPPIIDSENIFKPIANKDDFWSQNYWWVITLISVSSVLVISLVLVRKIRKNRNIR